MKFSQSFGNLFTVSSNGSSSVTINGKTFKGSQVRISGDGNIVVDGKVEDTVTGNLKVEVDADVIESLEVASGDVEIHSEKIGDVNVQSGNVVCGNVAGNVDVQSGDVKCGKVAGKISVMAGDVSVG